MIVGAILATWVGLNFTEWPGWRPSAYPCWLASWRRTVGRRPRLPQGLLQRERDTQHVMMNAIAVQLMNFLLRGPMIDPAQAELASKIPQTARLLEIFRLPRLAPTRLHLGALIAVVLAILVYVLLWRTTLGYRIRAVGQNPHASRYAGIRVPRYVVLACS